MAAPTTPVPNHHADFPGFSGAFGAFAGLSMLVGRDALAELACDLTGLTAGDRIVDIGCGPGVAVRVAARRGASATGVDPAPVMLRMARFMTRDKRIGWLEGTAESLPLPDADATIAWSLSTVHHWPDIDRGLTEARRVLRPGGRFLSTERRVGRDAHGHASHGWTIDQADAFAQRCDALGLVDIDVATHTVSRGPTISVRAVNPV